MKKYNKKPIILLMTLVLLFSFSMFLFPVKAYNEPKTSQGVDLTVIMLGDQQVPGVENVTAAFLASPLGSGVDTVTVSSSGADASAQLTYLQSGLQARSYTSHVIAIDVVWTAPFVKNGWLINLDPFIGDVDLNDYGSGIVAATLYQGHHYAFPYFMNLGVLYYRTDLLDLHMPGWTPADFATWEGLNATANYILNNESGLLTPADANLVGYIGQMDSYEGGVVNFFEWCGSNGALDLVTSSGGVNIDTPAVNDAMDFLAALIPGQYTGVQGTPYIIPRYGLVYDEASSANKWLANESIFLRQWPYVYALSEDAGIQFGLAPLPHFAGATGYKTSAVGGAILAVPTDTQGVAREAAINFTKFMGMQEAQEAELTADTVAGDGKYTPEGNFPALLSVYASPPTGFEYIENWSAQAALTLSRPVNPNYPLISNTIAGYFSNLLAGQKSVSDALADMQRDVSQIVAPTVEEPSIPGYSIAIILISFASTIGIIVFAKRKLQ